ncbi:MAG: type II toxin-antitoxin system RelE/ParE family toxin [Syntrophomonadaceae bacterium]|jgi:mRNA interferase RelE/StbE|nr:type II toxin-antitoxin system RelE/ParE family toxin [Syntrophomonadaceae bacterium]
MNYKIYFTKSAQKFIEKQPKDIQLRLYKAIYKLPVMGDIKQLKNQENKFRLRVGDYRIIFTIQSVSSVILVLVIGNRGDVYKRI